MRHLSPLELKAILMGVFCSLLIREDIVEDSQGVDETGFVSLLAVKVLHHKQFTVNVIVSLVQER